MPSANLLGVSVLALAASTSATTTLTVTNNCNVPIWPVMDTLDTTPPTQGWEALPNSSRDIIVADNYVGRIWPRQACKTLPSGKFSCATGDCGDLNCTSMPASTYPNITVVEFSLNGQPNNYYDINIMGGFNLPVELATDLCPSVTCLANFTASCPKELHGATDSNGVLLSCLSSCTAGIGNPDQQQTNCGSGGGIFGGGTLDPKDIDYFNWFNSGCSDGANATVPACSKNPTKYTITYCPSDTVNIAAPANDFASASTFTGSITSSTAKSPPTHTSGTTLAPSPTTSGSSSGQSKSGNGGGAKTRTGTSTAAIVGAIVGALVLLMLLGLGGYLLWRRRHRRRGASDDRVVPLEQYVRPYEAGLVPSHPISEKKALPSTPKSPGRTTIGSSSAGRTDTEAEFEERFEERFQTRLMHFLQTQMDAPAAPGAPKEALPGYPGRQAASSDALLRRNSGSNDDIITHVGS